MKTKVMFALTIFMNVLVIILLTIVLVGCASKKSTEYFENKMFDIEQRDIVGYKNGDELINGVYCKKHDKEVSENVCLYANAYFQMHHFYKARNLEKYGQQKDKACDAYLKLTDTDLQVLHQYAIQNRFFNKPLIDDDLVKVWRNWCIDN